MPLQVLVAAQFISPVCYSISPDAVTHLRLACALLRTRLNAKLAYDARCAGLAFAVK